MKKRENEGNEIKRQLRTYINNDDDNNDDDDDDNDNGDNDIIVRS